MKIAVRYQSRGGNTRTAAEVIAECAGVKAEPINTPLTEPVDLLFLGGGVYMWDADPQLTAYLKEADADKIGLIAAFSTTGAMKKTVTRITEYAHKAGIKTTENQLCLKMLLRGHKALRREGGRLTEKQIAKIKRFVSEVIEKLKKEI